MRSTVQNLALLFFVGPLALAACGVGTSQSTGPQHNLPPTPPVDDAGGDVNVGPPPGCTDDNAPQPECTDCNGNPVAPVCEGTTWQCPEYGCPIQFPDAGCGDSFPVSCPASPGGECAPFWSPQCVQNQWTCVQTFPDCDVVSPPPFDVWAPPPDDAGPPPDDATSPPGPFACGNVGCDPATSYCQITTGGPVNDDGGSTGSYCIPLPTTCSAGASCACIQEVQGIGCGCVQSQGEVTVTCEIP